VDGCERTNSAVSKFCQSASDHTITFSQNDDKQQANNTYFNEANHDHTTAGAWTTNSTQAKTRFDALKKAKGLCPSVGLSCLRVCRSRTLSGRWQIDSFAHSSLGWLTVCCRREYEALRIGNRVPLTPLMMSGMQQSLYSLTMLGKTRPGQQGRKNYLYNVQRFFWELSAYHPRMRQSIIRSMCT
jgi:hypothetical protein